MGGTMLKKTTKLMGAVAIALALTFHVAPVKAEETVTVIYNAPKKSALAKAAKKFVKEANKAFAGEIKFKRVKKVRKKKKLKKANTDKKVAKAVKKSRVDIGIVSADMAKAVRKPLAIFEMPWLVTNSVEAETLLSKKKGIMKKVKRATGRGKFVLVGTMNRGFQYLATFEKPFTKPSDLKGLWISTENSGYVRKALKAYGAKYGVMNGKIASLKVIAKKKKSYMPGPKYVSNVPMLYTPALVLFSKKNKKMKKLFMTKYKKKGKTKWKWNANGKKLVKAAKKASKLSWKLATENDQKAWAKIMKKKKIKVMKIDLNAFRKASGKVYRDFETNINGAYGTLKQVRKVTGVMAGS
jgi:TRAP-type C4-dicarboxylate transport system substrate-binding protein